jgi:hypothetical protein
MDARGERMVSAVFELFPVFCEEDYIILDFSLSLKRTVEDLKESAAEGWQRVIAACPTSQEQVGCNEC